MYIYIHLIKPVKGKMLPWIKKLLMGLLKKQRFYCSYALTTNFLILREYSSWCTCYLWFIIICLKLSFQGNIDLLRCFQVCDSQVEASSNSPLSFIKLKAKVPCYPVKAVKITVKRNLLWECECYDECANFSSWTFTPAFHLLTLKFNKLWNWGIFSSAFSEFLSCKACFIWFHLTSDHCYSLLDS